MNEEPKFLIYGLRDPRNGLIRYVGQSKRGYDRPREHVDPHILKTATIDKRNWINELKSLGLTYEIVDLEILTGPEGLDEAEIKCIEFCKIMGQPLVNGTIGGKGRKAGWKASTETRDRMSKARTGTKKPDWVCQKTSKTNGSKPFQDDQGNTFVTYGEAARRHGISSTGNVSAVCKGRVRSANGVRFSYLDGSTPEWDETPSNIKKSRSHGGRPIEDELGNIYQTTVEVAEKLGLHTGNICKALRGQAWHCGGHRFKYVGEDFPEVSVTAKCYAIVCSNGEEFSSIDAAAKKIGITRQSIYRNLKLNDVGKPVVKMDKIQLGFAYSSNFRRKSRSHYP